MQLDAGTEQLARLNSLTKYPSILTYHSIGERGKLDKNIQVPFEDDDDVIVTEKIDGTNARIIRLLYDDFVIGSREELLHAKGDRIWIPTGGIVDATKWIAENAHSNLDRLCVVFGEVFGGKASAGSKNYTGNKSVGFRVFDVMVMDSAVAYEMTTSENWSRQKISSWRQHGGQSFLPEKLGFSSSSDESVVAEAKNIGQAVTPRLCTIKGKDLPKDHKGVLDWLHRVTPNTKVRLDDGAKAKSEGVVVRTNDRSKIAKIRYEDYERTLRPQKPGKKKR